MKSDALADSRDAVISRGRLAFIAALSGVLGGAAAIVMVIFMWWLCNRTWVVDEAESHGISELQSSRLGGVAVFLGVLVFIGAVEWAAGSHKTFLGMVTTSDEQYPDYTFFALMIALVGLWDDFVSRSLPIARLALVLAISSVAVVSDAVRMMPSAYEWLPFGLNNALLLTIAGVIIVTGFVNAGNMADGANGLLGIIGVSFFTSLMHVDLVSFAPLLVMALLIFIVFNVSTGRIFLGDFGAYGLSALIAFGSLELYASGRVSLWFLGSLLAYPCIEMIRVTVERVSRRSSPFQASNDHLHNYMYELLRNWGWKRVVANSTTGCLVGSVSALLPASLVLLEVIDINSTDFWGWYFCGYTGLHLCLTNRLKTVLLAK